MKSIQGFTLFELIVVIVIIAIISVFAIPAMSTFLLKQNLNASAHDLVIDLQKARSKAALERRSVIVHLNSSSANSDNSIDWTASGKAVLVSTTTSIIFQTDGLVQDPINTTAPLSSDLTLVLCDQTQANAQFSKRIIISRMGTIEQGDLVTGDCNATS